MRYPRKRPMKKLIYLELVVLSALLVVAVIIASRADRSGSSFVSDTPHPNASKNTEVFSQETATEFVPDWKTYPADRQLTAKQHFVFDCKKKEFLQISGLPDERVYPASITKLFTAYTIMRLTAIGSDEQCIVGDELDLVAYGSSVAGLKKGDQLSAVQLMEAMLLCSGNDAAYTLACQAGRNLSRQTGMPAADAVAYFVNEMNALAKQCGMVNTNFVNPDGIHDANHYTTMQDLVIMGSLCLEFNSIMNTVIAPKAHIKLHGETIEWKNTNALIDPESEYYCRYAIGLKTGQTPDAGSCLLSLFYKDGQYFLIGVFGCPATNDRFDDSLQLFNQTILQ